MGKAATKTFHFPEVRVVEASAGSGKTYALARRYIQLLLNPQLQFEQTPIRNILAITFTNKAAFEMKLRILEFLKKIALQQLTEYEVKTILEPIGIDALKASRKAATIMEDLIRNYNFFQVQTIDSFINALLSGCAFKIGLSANFKIKRNAKEYLEHSLDELIEQALHDKKTRELFESFLHQYLFIENRSGWFPKDDILGLVTALYQQGNLYGLPFKSYGLSTEKLIVKKRKILELMKSLHEQMPEAVDGRFVRSLEGFLEANTHGFDVDNVSNYFARPDFPIRKNGDYPRTIDKLWEDIRRHLKELCEWEAYSIFDCYIDVFNGTKAKFAQLAAEDDVLFLEELNKKARALFDEGAVTVEELYYRLATRFHHYLIDEFQDTSVLQWQNLFLMVEEALSTRGSLFYVGDKKQAIYGFRGGEIRLFDHLKQKFAQSNVQEETLLCNYRSRRNIVQFNNQIFSLDNLKRFVKDLEEKRKDEVHVAPEDMDQLENIFHAATQEVPADHSGGYIKVETIEAAKKEECSRIAREKVVALLHELKARYSLGDIAILTRNNSEVEETTSWLVAAGFSVESERTTNIKENFIIQELIAFFKFLDSPIDNVSFASFILGDCFAKAAGLKPQELHNFVFNLRNRHKKEKDWYVYKSFRNSYFEIWDRFVDEFFKNVGLYPLYELAVSVINRFQILQNFPEFQGYVMKFLEIIKTQEDEVSDLTSFLEYFEELEGEELYVTTTDSNAVKILTIHKSKGLEFPVVIIPFLEMDVQVGSRGDNQQSFILQFKDEAIELLRLKKTYGKFSEELAEIWRQQFIKALFAELNNVYVGLTRAAQEMYLFVPQKCGNGTNLANFLIPAELFGAGSPPTSIHKPTSIKQTQKLTLPLSQYHDWMALLKDEFMDDDRVLNRRGILKGELVHAMLALIGNLKKAEAGAIASAIAQARLLYPHIQDFKEYEARFKAVLQAPALRDFFYVEDGEVYQEIDVVDKNGQTRRLDRLIIKKNEVLVIDYKSARFEGYTQQVQAYMEILKSLYLKKNIRGFIVYLDELASEEVQMQASIEKEPQSV